jgi:hypothetical protein
VESRWWTLEEEDTRLEKKGSCFTWEATNQDGHSNSFSILGHGDSVAHVVYQDERISEPQPGGEVNFRE